MATQTQLDLSVIQASTLPGLAPDLFSDPTPLDEHRFRVIIFNNDHNTIDEVINILMAATGCDEQEAYIETWEAHVYGQANVHFASEGTCREIAQLISTIGVKTDVRPEWENE